MQPSGVLLKVALYFSICEGASASRMVFTGYNMLIMTKYNISQACKYLGNSGDSFMDIENYEKFRFS